MDKIVIVLMVTLIGFLGWQFVNLLEGNSDCENRGGVYVRGAFGGFACVAAPLKPLK